MEEEKKINDALIEKESVEPSVQESAEEETVEEKKELDPDQIRDRKIKNLISAVILLAGLFVGSLFVDGIQLVRGGGFSQRALQNTDVLTDAGKTWVAYSEPIVKLQVISDDTCDACKPDEVLVGLKQALPTMTNEKIDYNSAEGKKLIAQFNIKTIPAFIFSKEIEQTDLFAKAQPFLDKQGDFYAIKSAEAGFPIGKYIVAPTVGDQDITIGSNDAKVKVFAYTNFQNPADKANYTNVIMPMLKDYGDKIQLVVKNYVPASATQADSAAIAASCANEQGKFAPYADKLFAGQTAWGAAKDTTLLKTYAQQAGLDTGAFNTCLDSKKYQDSITATLADGQSFGVQATPSMFVNTQLQTGTFTYDDVKKAIDGELAK